ncbi:hypothetical protein ACIPY2_14330 [Paenarthrobacter sp. NPDC089675]|uniref:hypothetical protein n=1 Tax=Paenarthrobacter sp. NPDC089675 TaxID=3364376 RepID=UPI0038211FE2
MLGREIKRIGYTSELTDALRRKKQASNGRVDLNNSPTSAKPVRVPTDVIADQVAASMAVEGRIGQGSTFTVLLPVGHDDVAAAS